MGGNKTMKSELQKAKEASAKDKDKFAAWLYKKIQVSPRGTISALAVYLGKNYARVHEYSRGIRYPEFSTRKKIKSFFEKK